jgi:hypothetical protein
MHRRLASASGRTSARRLSRLFQVVVAAFATEAMLPHASRRFGASAPPPF